jgi:hypothetical protein
VIAASAREEAGDTTRHAPRRPKRSGPRRSSVRRPPCRPAEVARAILASDDAILAILLSDFNGNPLVYVAKKGRGAKTITDKKEIRRISFVETFGLKLAPRPGQASGKVDYYAYVYQNFKLVVTRLSKPLAVASLKLTQSSNTEYVVYKILQRYRSAPNS